MSLCFNFQKLTLLATFSTILVLGTHSEIGWTHSHDDDHELHSGIHPHHHHQGTGRAALISPSHDHSHEESIEGVGNNTAHDHLDHDDHQGHHHHHGLSLQLLPVEEQLADLLFQTPDLSLAQTYEILELADRAIKERISRGDIRLAAQPLWRRSLNAVGRGARVIASPLTEFLPHFLMSLRNFNFQRTSQRLSRSARQNGVLLTMGFALGFAVSETIELVGPWVFAVQQGANHPILSGVAFTLGYLHAVDWVMLGMVSKFPKLWSEVSSLQRATELAGSLEKLQENLAQKRQAQPLDLSLNPMVLDLNRGLLTTQDYRGHKTQTNAWPFIIFEQDGPPSVKTTLNDFRVAAQLESFPCIFLGELWEATKNQSLDNETLRWIKRLPKRLQGPFLFLFLDQDSINEIKIVMLARMKIHLNKVQSSLTTGRLSFDEQVRLKIYAKVGDINLGLTRTLFADQSRRLMKAKKELLDIILQLEAQGTLSEYAARRLHNQALQALVFADKDSSLRLANDQNSIEESLSFTLEALAQFADPLKLSALDLNEREILRTQLVWHGLHVLMHEDIETALLERFSERSLANVREDERVSLLARRLIQQLQMTNAYVRCEDALKNQLPRH